MNLALYLLSKLSEAEENEARSRPSSLQGTQAINEEFYQRHEEEARDSEEAVDWGALRCHIPHWYASVTVLFVCRLLGRSHQWYTPVRDPTPNLAEMRVIIQTIKDLQQRILRDWRKRLNGAFPSLSEA